MNRKTPSAVFLGCMLVSACAQIPLPVGEQSTSSSAITSPSAHLPISSVSSSASSRVEPSNHVTIQPSSSASSATTTVTDSTGILPVPFTSQAPFANWDDPYQEACEEASMIMVHHWLYGTSLTPEIADRDILDLVAWETDHGYGQDITAAQMAEIAEQKWNLRARVRDDVTIETIKDELRAGNAVIVPVAGRMLGNPYFSGEGPWYHALVIRGFKEGWTGDFFVTNDPGTKRGANYEYDVDTLLNAIHDWTGVKEEIAQGKKAMVILER